MSRPWAGWFRMSGPDGRPRPALRPCLLRMITSCIMSELLRPRDSSNRLRQEVVPPTWRAGKNSETRGVGRNPLNPHYALLSSPRHARVSFVVIVFGFVWLGVRLLVSGGGAGFLSWR